ncbi:hypothetical protein JNUCC23_08900 [Peribacillus sp. JNUCC 23]
MIIRISNILRNDGSIDYKGLNTTNFVRGSQVYILDEAICAVNYDGDIIENNDIVVIDQMEYDALKAKDTAEKENNELPETELQKIKVKQELMQKAIDDLIFGGVL